MRTPLYCVSLLAIAVTTGCAGSRHNNPVIDPAGVDMGQYQDDLVACQQISQQVEQKAGAGAVGGAIFGALVGSILGDSRAAMKSAGAGAVVGGAKGGAATQREKGVVVKNCMRERGYTVLN